MIAADAADVLCFSSYWVGGLQSFLTLSRVAALAGIRRVQAHARRVRHRRGGAPACLACIGRRRERPPAYGGRAGRRYPRGGDPDRGPGPSGAKSMAPVSASASMPQSSTDITSSFSRRGSSCPGPRAIELAVNHARIEWRMPCAKSSKPTCPSSIDADRMGDQGRRTTFTPPIYRSGRTARSRPATSRLRRA